MEAGVKNKRLFAHLFLGLFALSLVSCQFVPSGIENAQSIPIQHNGRVKPLASFAAQTVRLLSGSGKWEKKSSLTVMLDAMKSPEKTTKWKWLRVDYPPLKEELGLEGGGHFFSLEEVTHGSAQLENLVRSAKTKRDNDARPTKLEQKAENLYTKYHTAGQIASGEIFALIPTDIGHEWKSPFLTRGEMSEDFTSMMNAYGEPGFNVKAQNWVDAVHAIPSEADIQKVTLEVLYNNFKPFEWAAVLYFLMFFLTVFAGENTGLKFAGVTSLIGAFLFHTAGLVMRVLILSRPPVSNMYESMVFMNWVLIVAAFIFAGIKKNLVPLTVSAFMSGLIMLYANLLPIDPSLEVLVPVLRSNYWLTIHVMTIVSSYGIFGLALALGHRQLFLSIRGRLTKKAEEESANLIHRVIQLGVLFIGTGTVLGGVWANESWGRFWGWDPKETWALITFLGYLVPVHLRYAKKLSNFGMALFAIVNFLLVLMTWYGVNFVLGRGLHSYGAGTGGMVWIIYYLIFEAGFVAYILINRKKAKTRR